MARSRWRRTFVLLRAGVVWREEQIVSFETFWPSARLRVHSRRVALVAQNMAPDFFWVIGAKPKQAPHLPVVVLVHTLSHWSLLSMGP
jgi:hypothetical protein